MTLKALALPALITAAAALMLPAPAANAIPMTFTAVLSGANELPNPVPSPGTGLATVVLDVSLGRCREAEAGRTE